MLFTMMIMAGISQVIQALQMYTSDARIIGRSFIKLTKYSS